MAIILSVVALVVGALAVIIAYLYVTMPPMPKTKKTGSKYRIDSDGCQ